MAIIDWIIWCVHFNSFVWAISMMTSLNYVINYRFFNHPSAQGVLFEAPNPAGVSSRCWTGS